MVSRQARLWADREHIATLRTNANLAGYLAHFIRRYGPSFWRLGSVQHCRRCERESLATILNDYLQSLVRTETIPPFGGLGFIPEDRALRNLGQCEDRAAIGLDRVHILHPT